MKRKSKMVASAYLFHPKVRRHDLVLKILQQKSKSNKLNETTKILQ